MEKLKIDFSDFWPSFKKTDNFFWNMLSSYYDLELSSEPDIVFYSYFGNNFKNYKCTRVLFQGENARPNFKECDFSFSFDLIPDNPRNYRLPLYIMYDDLNKLTLPKDPPAIAREKTKFCAFVVSNKYSAKRINFFKKLSKYKRVDSGGQLLNNIGGPVENKLQFINEYKFTIAFENSSYPGYTTEKIFEPMLVNSIPIYWGNPLINKEFNTESFINCHDFKNENDVIQRIIEIDNNPDEYLKMLSKPYLINNKTDDAFKEENIMDQMEKIIQFARTEVPVAKRYQDQSQSVFYVKNKMKHLGIRLRYLFNMD